MAWACDEKRGDCVATMVMGIDVEKDKKKAEVGYCESRSFDEENTPWEEVHDRAA